MDRITGNEVQSMMEAYASVYRPTLTEEVINSTAEQWVAACIEEGINFEEYTLDEITEAFIADCDQPEVLNEFFGMQGAQNFGADMRQRFGQARRALGGALANVGRGVKDVAGATAQGVLGQKTTSQNPIARAGNMITRAATAPQRAGAALVGGFLTGRRSGGTAPAAPAGNTVANKAQPAAQKPPTAKERAYGPKSTLNADQQAVNREYDRLRAKDPEAALAYGKKMAARGAAKSDFKIEKPTQAQSNPTAAQKQASVDAAIKSVNTPEKMNKPAPVGSALRAQQDKQAAANAAANAPRPTARPGARNAQRAAGGIAGGRPAPKPVAGGSTAVGSAAAAKPAGGYQLPAGARPMTAPGRRPMARPGARNRMEEVDIFDTIKEYLIDEGATEEEALKQMLTLTDEQRTEILEGSCGSKSKKKKKSRKGGY
tara:strand:- start:28 stop:1317 length:1290 start_codon:yes stop_codon:yes gene_type:complete